ncbi:MAG: Fe-S metabolism associated SufE [Pedosphaera sp.]|nr:Fe-S metabolism associated SufE [Pedosphaera sp.]
MVESRASNHIGKKMTLIEKKQNLLATLSQIKDAQERFAYVVERGRRQPLLDASLKTDEFRVEGCLAKLWIVPEFKGGKCYFRTDSDSAIMKGVSSVLCEFYSGQKPEEIVSIDPSFLGQVGITQHLTQNRRNGLARVWEKIRGFAQSHQKAEPPPSSSTPTYL